ncbi:MAG: hypothetical protein V1909_07060 [Candidatus Micrarchaeota archaeon]
MAKKYARWLLLLHRNRIYFQKRTLFGIKVPDESLLALEVQASVPSSQTKNESGIVFGYVRYETEEGIEKPDIQFEYSGKFENGVFMMENKRMHSDSTLSI